MTTSRKAKGSRWIIIVVAVSMLVPLAATGAVIYIASRTPADVVAPPRRFFDDGSRIAATLSGRFGDPPRLSKLVVYEGRVEAERSDASAASLFTFGKADAERVPKVIALARSEAEHASAKPSRLVLEHLPEQGSEPVWTVHFEDPGGASPVVLRRDGTLMRPER